ncbi:TPA: glycosyltransferase [Clostridium perfringens]
MKVLQINSVCGVGSTGRIATDLYKVLEEQGHECVIAYGRGTAPEGIKTIKIGTDFDNYMHVAKTRIFDKHGFGSTKATKEFIKKVKEYDPDVIHLHNIHGYYINIEILFNYLKEANKKVIWTLHDCWAFTGHCAYFDYVECNKWKKECKSCPQRKEYPISNIIDNSNWNFKKKNELFNGVKNLTIVTPSEWLGNLVKKSFLNRYYTKVIYNGIDLEIFKPTSNNFKKINGIEKKKIILGVASIWDRRKGLDKFIKLNSLLNDEYKIVLIGINKKQKIDLPKDILAIERTNNIHELVQIYTAADIFVNASDEETMGLVTIEALACGTPVIVNDSTAVPEVIDKTCGIVYKKNVVNDLFRCINLMSENKIKKDACLKKASQYNKLDKYNEYIKLYSS